MNDHLAPARTLMGFLSPRAASRLSYFCRCHVIPRGVDGVADYRARGLNCPSSHLQSGKGAMKIVLAINIESKEIDRSDEHVGAEKRLVKNHFRSNKMWEVFLCGFHKNRFFIWIPY